MRTIEVTWESEHTTVLLVADDGSLSFGADSTPGPCLTGDIIDPEGGPDLDRDAVLDFIIEEVA